MMVRMSRQQARRSLWPSKPRLKEPIGSSAAPLPRNAYHLATLPWMSVGTWPLHTTVARGNHPLARHRDSMG